MNLRRTTLYLAIVASGVVAPSITFLCSGACDVPGKPGVSVELLFVRGNYAVTQVQLDGQARTLLQSKTGFSGWAVHPTGGVVAIVGPPGPLRREYRTVWNDRILPPLAGCVRTLETKDFQFKHGTFSPDGKWLAFYHDERPIGMAGKIVVLQATGTIYREITLPGEISYAGYVAWDHNAGRLAFYYTSHSSDWDDWAATRGVAVADLGGTVRVIAKPSVIVGYEVSQRRSPPWWSPDGKKLYFTAGPERGVREVSHWYQPGPYCYEADVESGRIVLVSPGDVCGIAPNGSYLLLRYCPGDRVLDDEIPVSARYAIRRETESWRIDLLTRRRSVLPGDVKSPILSPSGEFAVDPGDGGLSFYSTQDWKLIRTVGDPGPRVTEAWDTHHVWVVSGNLSVSNSQQPTTTRGGE